MNADSNATAREHAVSLVEQFGWYVFRLSIGHDEDKCDGGEASCKTVQPIGGRWITSNDPAVVAEWDWSQANAYGIDCGRSGIVVADQDPGAAWPFNGTRIHGTGRGLHHIYEDLLGLPNKVRLQPWGVDVRGVGGMIIGPGSWHPHGAYTVEKDSAPGAAPPEFLEALRESVRPEYAGPEYDGPGFDGLDPWVQARVNDDLRRQTQAWRDLLEEAAEWAEGATDDRGRGWDALARDWAWTCALWAARPWTGVDEHRAAELHASVLPDVIASDPKCAGKWSPALVEKAAGETVPPPPGWEEWLEFQPSAQVIPLRVVGDVEPQSGEQPQSGRVDVGTSFEYGPSRYIRKGGGLEVDRVVRDINAVLPLAVDRLDRRLMAYNGGVWMDAEDDVSAAITVLFGGEWTPSRRNTIKEFAKDSPSTPRLSREPGSAEFINCRNGLVKWRNGEVEPLRQDVLYVTQVPWNYVPEAQCPAFEAYLAQVLPEDAIPLVWELLGYLLYPGNPFHVAGLLHGPKGRNGKGTLLRVIRALIGGANISAVDLTSLVEDKFMVAELYGKSVNIAGDIDAKWMEHTALFKGITGGDEMKADRKYGQPFTFTPWVVPLFSANELFGTSDSSEAFFARWIVVPFPHSFHGREDRDLTERLVTRSEMEGILAKAIAALPGLMARGRFDEPESVRAARHELATAGDSVRQWIEECYEMEPETWADRRALWDSYRTHGGNLGRNKFYGRLEQIEGIRRGKRDGIEGFFGLREVSSDD